MNNLSDKIPKTSKLLLLPGMRSGAFKRNALVALLYALCLIAALFYLFEVL